MILMHLVSNIFYRQSFLDIEFIYLNPYLALYLLVSVNIIKSRREFEHTFGSAEVHFSPNAFSNFWKRMIIFCTSPWFCAKLISSANTSLLTRTFLFFLADQTDWDWTGSPPVFYEFIHLGWNQWRHRIIIVS